MTTTNGVNSTDPYAFLNGTKTTKETKSNQELGQNEFLTLMMAQMKNQDPTKPTDTSQFLSQLAQFSTVTSVQNMETSIKDLTSSLRSTQVLSGTSLVGHSILAPGTTQTIDAGASVQGSVDIPSGSSKTQVAVYDSAGVLVRQFDISNAQGLNDFTWDGKDNTGTAVPAGTYKFEVNANVAGEPTALDPLLFSKVESVTIDSKNGSLTLNTSAGAVDIGDVHRVL